MESVGFKEWALVCDALGEGRQSVILRKGGIAEGRDGFQFRHREFFLFPTFFHEQLGRVRLTNAILPPRLPNEIEVRFFARIEETLLLRDWETIVGLQALHILQESVVRERFEYDDSPALQVAFVRIFRLEKPWRFPNAARYGGCRSWADLPELPANLQLKPVLTEAQHERHRVEFDGVIKRAPLTRK